MGAPQGMTLGLLMFLVEVNVARMNPPPPLQQHVQEGDVACVPAAPAEAITRSELRIKYVNDLTTIAEVVGPINLVKRDHMIVPRNLHDINDLKLSPDKSRLQQR